MDEKTRHSESNLRKFYAFSILYWIVFWQPIIVLFWLQNGVSMTDAYLIKGLHGLVVVLLDGPTGVLADYIGKRLLLFMATVAGVCSLIIYCIGNSFAYFLVAELLAAVGTSFISGADSAFVYQTLAEVNQQDKFSAVMGKILSIQLFAQTASGIIGGVVAGYSYRLTLILSLLCVFPSMFVTFSMKEPIKSGKDKGTRYSDILAQSFKIVSRHKMVRWLVFYFGLLVSFDLTVLWTYQPYMQSTGLPVIYFGLAFAAFNLLAAIVSLYAQKIQQFLRNEMALILLPVVMISAGILMSRILVPWSFLFILGLQFTRGMRTPIVHSLILKHVREDQQATVLSFTNLMGRFLFIAFSPLFGWVSDQWGIPSALGVTSLIVLVCFLVLGVWFYLQKLNRPQPELAYLEK